MSRVASRIPDKRVLKLIRAFLNAGVLEDGLVRPVERATHCAESPRQVQRPNPGNHMPDARDQFAADDRRPHAIPHRMARVLRLLPDPARAHEPGSLDSPEIAFVSLAAMAERAQPIYGASPPRHREVRRIGRSRFTDGTLAHVRTPGGSTRPTKSCVRLSWSPPNLHACAGLTRSNRRGTDPYARWCGRGGVARRPPIPINGFRADEGRAPFDFCFSEAKSDGLTHPGRGTLKWQIAARPLT